jgi:DNA helicase-2/ATP-dependent DNA helicase PcrA
VPAASPSLNAAQRAAVDHADGPLLIIAGAGSGKTHTLAHRVAALVRRGVDSRRILLLTFSRRAAQEMVRRAARLLGREDAAGALPWAGTFHSVANRLLRLHAAHVGLDPAFTVLDREDSADLLDRLRQELGLARGDRRFPRKGTCLAIHSRAVNATRPLRLCLEEAFPWCLEWEAALRRLFEAYASAKAERHLLDYDDLLLAWYHVMGEPSLAARIGGLFDHVLVDEYQDTNVLQSEVLRRLKPDGRGVTVVGDDAQAIYSFRAAEVRNILDFPRQFEPPATVVTLEENHRSTQPVLDAANAVIALAPERYAKELRATRGGGWRPTLLTVPDELAQVDAIVRRVLERREAGVPLRQQAVLFRAAHHSDALEVELGRRNIPFVKFGGLRFLEAAHVKDVVCALRWAENPRDAIAAFRTTQLLPGVGPHAAARVWEWVAASGYALADALGDFLPPAPARAEWGAFAALYRRLRDAATPWRGQLGLVRRWYEPHLERRYDDARTRAADLEQLEQLADASSTRERFLSDLALDPPDVTGAEAGPPHLDEDYLILSTIHSAKGQEWDSVYLLNVADGCMPSDMATATPAQIEEERRLLYVAMTRAKNELVLVHPFRFFVRQQSRYGDRAVVAPRSRFLPDALLDRFERKVEGLAEAPEPSTNAEPAPPALDLLGRLRATWG